MTDIVFGAGEVGSALAEVFGERRPVILHDPAKGLTAASTISPEWAHIAYPYGPDFLSATIAYSRVFHPQHLILHSTVPVGTTTLLQEKVVGHVENPITYSPVRGLHPRLAYYLRTFPKWIGQAYREESVAVREYYSQAGIQSRFCSPAELLEWLKLWETTEYYVRIAMWQEIEREAEDRFGMDGWQVKEAMKAWMYEKRSVYAGERGLVPILEGGVVGGHCLIPNLELLKPIASEKFVDWLESSNEQRKKELEK